MLSYLEEKHKHFIILHGPGSNLGGCPSQIMFSQSTQGTNVAKPEPAFVEWSRSRNLKTAPAPNSAPAPTKKGKKK